MANNIPELRFSEFTEDWSKLIIKDIATKITDGTHDTPKSIEKGIPYLTAIHVRDGFIDFENCSYLSEEDHQKIYKRCNPEKNDLLMVNIGAGVATSAMVNVDYEFSLKNVALIKPDNSVIESVFFAQIQRKNSAKLRHQISSGGAQPFLGLKDIGKLKLTIPIDKQEQTKIATFLTAVDKRINLLQKKKAELEQYKKGVMQKLFSQTLRFKKEDGSDFEDWEEKKLGDVCKVQGGFAFKSSNFKDNGTPIIRISNISNTDNFIDTSKMVYYDRIQKDKNYKIRKGDLLIAMSGATTGKTSIYNLETNAYVNQRVGLFKSTCESLFYPFITQFVLGSVFENELKSLLVAGAQPNISSSDIESIRIPFPKKEEQQKIANFLSSVDLSISSLSNQIDDSVQFKKGLLQQLFV